MGKAVPGALALGDVIAGRRADRMRSDLWRHPESGGCRRAGSDRDRYSGRHKPVSRRVTGQAGSYIVTGLAPIHKLIR